MPFPWTSIARLPITAYQHRHRINYWWKTLLVYIEKGDTNIVVMGRPAVGKSVLVAEMYGETKDYSWELPDTSTEVESKAIQLSEWTSLVRVIPGQTSLESYQGIDEAFNKHKNLKGVIYVVDWGFTNVRSNISKKSLIEDSKIDSIEKLRAYNLENERIDFTKICHKIAESHAVGRGPKWVIIAVNKADLFFDQIEEALSYYDADGKSTFAKVIQNMIKTIGNQNIRCSVVPVCSWETDFIWNNETIKTKIGGTENKRELFRYLLDTIATLSK